MNCIWSGAFLSFIALWAAADDNSKRGFSSADRLAAIQKEHKDAEAAFYKAVDALEENADGRKKYQEIYKDYDKGQGRRFAAAVEIAKADPKGDVTIAALEWVLTIPRAFYHPAGIAAMEEVTKIHAANPMVGKLVSWVGYYPPHDKLNPKEAAAAWAMIDAVAKENPDKTARAQAVLARVQKAKENYDGAAYKNQPDAEKLATVAEAAYEAVIKEYGDCRRLIREDRSTVGDFARSELFEMRNLRVGKTAPDIEGEDLDGVKFKLSDYRGKVIVLDFWGDW